MDASRFDALTRSLSAAGTRRHALLTALGGALGAFGLAEVRAAKSGKCKPKCGECEKCKKGTCNKKNGKKRCKKGKCQPKAAGTPCTLPSGGTCEQGTCACTGGSANCGAVCRQVKSDAVNCGACGTVCTANHVCQAGSCFPSSICPATVTSYCSPPFGAFCGSGTSSCFCGRSAEGNVVCLLDEDELCMGSGPRCDSSATCPPGEACVDVNGCCPGDPAGSKRCLAP